MRAVKKVFALNFPVSNGRGCKESKERVFTTDYCTSVKELGLGVVKL